MGKMALFGLFGVQLNATDCRYVYMRSPISERPVYQYTLMPTCHGGRRAFIKMDELERLKLFPGFSFTKGQPVMQILFGARLSQKEYETMLFDLESDPGQNQPIKDEAVEKRMGEWMKERMRQKKTNIPLPV